MISHRPFVACIAGPTASGKTDAAIAACKALDGEVISMDSMQIYRELTVGTAKPADAEMQGVPHHMLSCVPPDASYSVSDYQRDAKSAMRAILARNKLPVFSGGTGLYLQSVSHPLQFTSAAGESPLRAQLQEEAEEPNGPQRLHQRLAAIDPLSAERLHANNTRRIVRALEVFETTGIPMSEQQREWDAEPEEDWCIFVMTWPREVLYQRIDARVDRMMEMGLVEEVEGLLRMGLSENTQSMKAIGYKEIIAMLHGRCTKDEAIAAIKQNTRRYAKRQLTWFRREPRAVWIDGADYTSVETMHGDIIRRIQEERNAEQ